ncbi:MAG: extracellular solute-binding protein [Mesorhizobium sp.]|nr:extracellular solute-binding protein [Mesorhizobium sp.]
MRFAALLTAALLGISFAQSPSAALAQEWQTTSSLIKPSKYAADFRHYDHVDVNAPKGGTLNRAVVGTFNSFNPFIVRGAAAAGLAETGGLLYDTLMVGSLDEPGVAHPLIAEALKYPADFSSVTYRLNPSAKWHDGTPITAEDVVWSFNVVSKQGPLYTRYYANVTEAVALSEREVEFRFDQKGNRELPHIIGDLVVLPKHWWEGTDAQGRKRDISQPTLEAPLGSGAYRIENFASPKDITWVRIPDYWADDLPVNVGRHNFERLRFTYFLDENAVWQAFTKGGIADVRIENRAKRWATDYTFPAFTAGDVVKAEFERKTGQPMQAYVFNTRLAKFSDRRVRQALVLAFDFESLNRTTFNGLYTRTDSYFEGMELASSGLPEGEELAILEEYRDKLPPELFSQEFALPVYDTREAPRTHLRQATELLAAAGWAKPAPPSFWTRILGLIGIADVPDERFLVNAQGERFTITFLGDDPSDDRIVLPYVASLANLGIDASLQILDPGQYENRRREFSFEMIIDRFAQSLSPGNEQRNYWTSKAADAKGSDNTMGIRDPVVDALVERVIFANDRDDLIAATRALDRVLLWGFYVVPQWHNPYVWLAHWNRLGRPPTQPGYVGVDLDSWWVDAAKDAAFQAKYKGGN